MDQATNLVGASPINETARAPWTSDEENALYRIVKSQDLRGRTSTTIWERIADRLAATGLQQGFKRRTASSVRHRASKLGAYSREAAPAIAAAAPEALAPVMQQATFAAPEVRSIIAEAFEDVARRLRGVA